MYFFESAITIDTQFRTSCSKYVTPILDNIRKYQHSRGITDHKGEKPMVLEDFVRISINCFLLPIHSKTSSIDMLSPV